MRPVAHQLQRIASIGQIVAVPLLFGLLLIYTYVPGGRRTLRSQLPGAGLKRSCFPNKNAVPHPGRRFILRITA